MFLKPSYRKLKEEEILLRDIVVSSYSRMLLGNQAVYASIKI